MTHVSADDNSLVEHPKVFNRALLAQVVFLILTSILSCCYYHIPYLLAPISLLGHGV